MMIWRGYDQSGLDAQYQTRSQIGDRYEAWSERWRIASQQARAARQGRLDVPYGSHPREVLDLFPAPEATAPAPIAVFFHGGFWRARDKGDFSYVANGLAGLGASVAVVNYPLCPQASLDDVVRSARRSVRWLREHAGSFGGDADRLYVSGHSAGAHLAAACCCGPGELPSGAVKGALLSSGLYELEPVRLCAVNADIGLDDDQVRRLSPMRLVPTALAGPMVIAYGGAETEEFAWQAREFAAAMAKAGAQASVACVPEANHYTIVPQFDSPASQLLGAFAAALTRWHGS